MKTTKSTFFFSVSMFFLISYPALSSVDLMSDYSDARSQYQNGNYIKSNEILISLIEQTRLGEDYGMLGNAYYLRAYNCIALQQTDSALIAFYNSQDAYAISGNEIQYANITINIGHLFMKNRTFDIAQKYYAATVDISVELGDDRLLSDSYFNLGFCSSMMGDYLQAYVYYENALDYEEGLNHHERLAGIYLDQGVCQYKLKNYSIASDLFWKALAIGKEHGLGEITGMSYNHIADGKVQEGNFSEAEEYYNLSIENLPKNSLHHTIVLTNKANLKYKKGNSAEAIALYAKALHGEPSTIDMGDAYVAYDSLLAHFDATGQNDSALFYSKKMNGITRFVNEQEQKLNTADNQFALRAMYTNRATEERHAKKRQEQYLFFGLMSVFLLLTVYLFWMLRKRSPKIYRQILKDNSESLAYINNQIEADKRKLN